MGESNTNKPMVQSVILMDQCLIKKLDVVYTLSREIESFTMAISI